MPKCFLVTGGAGFIGSNFVEHILTTQPDARVITVDALTCAGSLANLEFAKDDSRHRFVRADIRDEEAMLAVMREEKSDCVVHFAAESHVDRSIEGQWFSNRSTLVARSRCLKQPENTSMNWMDKAKAFALSIFRPMKCMGIFPSKIRKLALRRMRRCGRARLTLRQKPRRICSCFRT